MGVVSTGDGGGTEINIPEYYDNLASDYDTRFVNPQLDYMRTVEDSVLDETLKGVGGIVLDVGCGTGKQTLDLAEKGFDVIGLDISSEMIRTAKKKSNDAGLSIPFLIASADSLPFKDGCISILISMFGAYSHIPAYDRAFHEISRVLADGGGSGDGNSSSDCGGRAVFTIVNRWNLNWWLRHTLVGNRDWIVHALKHRDFVSDGLWTYYFGRRELIKKMRNIGFRKTRVGSVMIFLYPHLHRIDRKPSLYLRVFGRIENMVRWAYPWSGIGYYLIAVVTK
ncbi:MAG: methyltransferase domain-containing protein [Methanosarcinales archaeon]|nr:methyltransferase domain-containing protein [Methanosarcinales archaeon]